jgi:Ca2+-binding RTX toxin-like protein
VREDVWLDPDGYDTVYASVNFRLEQGVEKLVLTQSYTRGTGNELANVLASQADYTELEGGDGNDTYLVASDTVRVNEWYGNPEDNRAGIDRVISTAEYYGLSPNVEILELAGTAIGGRGNEGDNTLIGNAQDNFLQGAGGNDLLQGGAGADVLSGDDGNDTLDGGAGADRMEGGYGDDLYIVDDSGDKIQDFGGVDTVRSSATSFWMGDGVENLVLEGGALEGIGNWLDNKIVGSAGDNMLYGEEGNDVLEGGAGNDQLRGGTGADRFVFGADSEGGRDIVFDFKAGEGDVIDLSGLDADPLQEGDQAFVVVEAFTANATGQLYFFNGSLYISTDAEPDADLVIELFGITAMPQEGVLL